MRMVSDIAALAGVERRSEPRVIMSLAGTCSLSALRDEAGQRREFPCRAINMSSRALMLAAPVKATLNDRAIAYIPSFGKLSGRIIRVLDGGFVMSLTVSEPERQKIARRLDWMQEHQAHDTHDLRLAARIVPLEPFAQLAFADGAILSCLVMDMSLTGAAISADMVPAIGTVLAVGKIPGRVCRHFPEGFAVAFLKEQEPGALEHLLFAR